MPTVTIDGQSFEFEAGQKLLQFCMDRGIEVPHFCYHPAMSIPANCRQCLVEVGMPTRDRATGEIQMDEQGNPVIQYMPKLQTSCSMDLSDGMVVKTQETSALAARAQQDTLEFLLINHPLDCPICDQAGECPLQNQAYKYGPEGSRFEFLKVHKPKHVLLGPRVMLDAERCINCTRCTRFTEEVSGSNQLSIIARGDKNYPAVAPGDVFDEPYSMNVIDLCPVGALTSHDFRFKARVWEMSRTPSISSHSARGVNVDYWVRDNLIMRITPRPNRQVNDYWIADQDRLDYERYNTSRPKGPELLADGKLVATDWEQAFARAAELLKDAGSNIFFLGSSHATVEDNYLLMKLAEAVGAETPQFISYRKEGSGDGWLVADDPAPNAQGCERLGMQPVDPALFRQKLAGVKLLYVLEDDPVAAGLCTADDLKGVNVVLHYYNVTNQSYPWSDVALPAAMTVETIGTYVNEDGVAQRVRPVKEIRTINRMLVAEMGKSRLDRQGTPFDRWHKEENKIDCLPGWEILPQIATRLGIEMQYRKGAKAVMQEIADQNPAFVGATYDAMGLLGVKLQDVGEAV